jgi:hypothetical protein
MSGEYLTDHYHTEDQFYPGRQIPVPQGFQRNKDGSLFAIRDQEKILDSRKNEERSKK